VLAAAAVWATPSSAVDITTSCHFFSSPCDLNPLTIREDTPERDILTIKTTPRDLFGGRHLDIVIDPRAENVSAEDGCGKDLLNAFHVTCGFPIGRASIKLGDLDDFLIFKVAADSTLDGEDGNDLITGGSGRDFIRGGPGSDILSGGDNKDLIEGDAGPDTINGGKGDDTIIPGPDPGTPDGVRDVISCGSGDDAVAGADDEDFVSSDCERVTRIDSVGTFGLTPRDATARAGGPVSLRLVWKHPKRWRALHTVDLRFSTRSFVFGEIRFDQNRGLFEVGDPYSRGAVVQGKPGAAEVLTRGPLSLLLSRSRVVGSGPRGKTVALTLSLRFGKSLAGRTVAVEAGATDDDGTQQPPRSAGTIRVKP
jgi:hypothetical protein